MAASNRAARLTKLVGALKKHFKPTPVTPRPLFETLLYAALAENSKTTAADKAMDELEGGYFDWNEVRVSARGELAERLKPLADPAEAADRLKRSLQSIFESVYAFDLEPLKKQNLGVAVKQIAGYDGVTPFAVAFATQNALSGHAIAVNSGVLLSLQVMEIITDAEAKKGQVPGLERAIPKSKGPEAFGLLHELGVEVGKNPYGQAARKLLTDLDPSCKDRLPKRPAKPAPAPEKKPKAAASKAAAPEPATAKAAAKKGAAAKTAATSKSAPSKKTAEKKAADTKPSAAKPSPSNSAAKATPSKVKAKPATKKPAKAATAKKGTAKKAPAKKKAATPAKKQPAKKATAKKVAKPSTAKKATAKKPAKRKPR